MVEPAGSIGSADADDRHRDRVVARLARLADADGFVPFDRFMELALYGEGVGFYSREGSPFGRSGDYYTAAHASPLFARTIAEWVRSVGTAIPGGGPFRVVELGPGDGTLGEGVVGGLAQDPAMRARVEYVLVERSRPLLARAFERVSEAARPFGISVKVAGGVGADGPFEGVVLANEVLDAQPTRRLLWDGRTWQEVGVRVSEGAVIGATAPWERPVGGRELPRPAAGTIVEVSPMAEALVREVADHLTAGRFLALDYGMDESELLAAHPSGTLAAVRRHMSVEDPIAHAGTTDLSVFVNFTRVRAAATAAGLREVAYRRQAEALGDWGFPRLLEEAVRSASTEEAKVRVRLAGKNLAFGFDRFQALELAPPDLPGPSRTLT